MSRRDEFIAAARQFHRAAVTSIGRLLNSPNSGGVETLAQREAVHEVANVVNGIPHLLNEIDDLKERIAAAASDRVIHDKIAEIATKVTESVASVAIAIGEERNLARERIRVLESGLLRIRKCVDVEFVDVTSQQIALATIDALLDVETKEST